jgi:hypothetical protein
MASQRGDRDMRHRAVQQDCGGVRSVRHTGSRAIGVALVLGVFVNLAAAAGALLLVLMWTAVLPPENNPFHG